VNPLPTNPLETFTYDPVGNRINSNQNGASIFNSANQLTEDANFTYQYDNNGNMTGKIAKLGGAVTQYEYDAENKLVRVVSPTNTANYRYDGLGRRVEKEVIAGTTVVTKYVYDNEDILLELNGANAIVARYTHGPGIDEPLIMEKNAQSFYYHADGLSSITELTNQAGGVIQRYAYSSFGKIESQLDPNFIQPYTFTAREFDPETGLHYYRARHYDPTMGRFLQNDPLGFAGGNANLYVYVRNNAVTWIDPFGLKPGDRFPSEQTAAIDAISYINPTSISLNREHGGYIYRNPDGTFSYTTPYSSGAQASTNLGPLPPTGEVTADYHTHGGPTSVASFDENFSGRDRAINTLTGRTGYLGTPRGAIKRFNPKTGREEVLRPQNVCYEIDAQHY